MMRLAAPTFDRRLCAPLAVLPSEAAPSVWTRAARCEGIGSGSNGLTLTFP